MNSNEYIISELNKFILEFSDTRVLYEHDKDSEIHFIEIIPNEVYHLDDSYIKWESRMFDSFIELFPDQNICFISDDALVGIDKIDFELCGKDYVPFFNVNTSTITISNSWFNINTSINNNIFVNVNFCSDMLHSNQINTLTNNKNTNFSDENDLPLAA